MIEKTYNKKELIQLEHIAAVIENSDDAIISQTLTGIITSWNPAAEKLFEYTKEEVLGKNILLLIPSEKINEEAYILKQIEEGKKVEHYETTRKKKDGSTFKVSLTVSPIKDETGKIIGASKISRDISMQKEAERQSAILASIVNCSDDAIISKNLNGIITSWNPAAERIFGYKSEEVIGKSILILIPEDRVNEEVDILSRIVSGERVDHMDTRRKTKFGNLIDISITVSPIKDSSGKVIGASKIARNITERKQAEEKIKASESKFRTLSETVPHMIWTATPDGKRNFFNRYLLDYTGKTFDELYGDGWQKMIFPLDLERTLKQWHHSLQTGEDFKNENRWRHHNGSYQWYLAHAIAQKDEEGNILGWVGTNTNISEQKSFAEALESQVKQRTYQLHIQNETFKQAEESSMQGSYSFNLTTGKIAYSDNLYRLIGYEPNAFIPSIEEFNKHVHSEDKDLVTQAAQKVIQSKMPGLWHYRLITKAGKLINIKGTGRIIASGEETLLVGTLQDVTKEFKLNKELQEKEAFRRQIINSAPDAVIVINDKSIITLWNPKTEEIFGWKAEEVIGLHLSETIVPSQYREAHQAGMTRLLKTGEARILNKTLELTALNKSGKEFPISLTISQATQQGNKLFIAFLRDITLEKQNKEELIVKTQQLKDMNQTLEIQNKELEKSNAELASFNYIASHDLKEPLRKIQTFSSRLIETENFSEISANYFNRITLAAERMENLIDSLLNFSQIASTQLVFEPCDLNMLVEESKIDLQVIILEKQVSIEYKNLPEIMGVPIQLSQLITNLLGNSIKYSRPDFRPLIKITSSIIEGENIEHPLANKKTTYHAIQFADNGIGFEQQYADRIFELFQRLHGRNEFSGTGIGLGIVKKIATYHNGFITAVGEPNAGATFTLYLPKELH